MAGVKKLNEVLGMSTSVFDEQGIFNPFIGVDTNLFLDPALLRDTEIPEFKGSYEKIVEHFAGTLRLLLASQSDTDIAWRQALKRTIFRETKGISIGYGATRSDGGGVGEKLARRIITTAAEILELGVNDPDLFEIIPLFEPGMGADRISDMAISIICEDIYTYTDRMVKAIGVPAEHQIAFKNGGTGQTYAAILHPDKAAPLFLLPKELLKDLPLALERNDIGFVSYFNETLRGKVGKYIAGDAARKLKDLTKDDYKAVLSRKEDLDAAIKGYRATKATPYDFDSDPAGEMNWYEDGQEFARAHPIEIAVTKPKTIEDVTNIVRQIIDQFGHSIENQNLYELLYKEPISALKPKNERAAQRLFYSIADTYCKANNVVLAREPNAGNGPVDFKVGSDYNTQVLVELKLSSGQVESGFTKQLPEYEKNERAAASYLVILRVTEVAKAAESVKERSDVARAEGKSVPAVILINALPRPSASKKK